MVVLFCDGINLRFGSRKCDSEGMHVISTLGASAVNGIIVRLIQKIRKGNLD